MNTQVAIVRCEDYTPSKVLKAVKEAVDLIGGMEQFVRQGQTVLIKPNLLSAHGPESAVCTHPAVVEAVLGLAAAAGGECVLGDGPAIMAESEAKYMKLLETTGMQAVLERTGTPAVHFDGDSSECNNFGGRVYRQFPVTKALDSVDVLINVPKFKTHGLTGITGAVKNLYGCLPSRRKLEFHLQVGDNPDMFAQVVVDLARAVRPTLSIMDAIVGMDGQGPSAGRRRNFGLIFASADPVALDAAACAAAGLDQKEIPTLRLAGEQGVGVSDPEMIGFPGLNPKGVLIEDFELPTRGDMASRMPKPVYRALKNQLTRKPTFIREKCTGCGTCVRICPANVISGSGKELKIDYSKCIRCFCCQEVCPEEAIFIRPGVLRKVVDLFSGGKQ